jgi:hypothetical protein
MIIITCFPQAISKKTCYHLYSLLLLKFFIASSSSSFTHTGINPGGGQVLVAQGLLDQAQVFGGPEQFVAMQSRLKGGQDRPCLALMK